ncbi:MAG: MaoC family dehydratase N-terminal domain-containing protein [Solirubrobacteraceae bacterium]|nr:MaoC family dehydratase N-terminal domain-containing protein [Solirubrobacteraceae bacterium]
MATSADTAPPAPPIGKAYPPLVYAVGREKIREFARATGETNPVHLDVAAARAAGNADLVAPPMFAVVYAGEALGAGLFDPETGIDMDRLVHGAQAFTWGRPVVAGEEITTVLSLDEVRHVASVDLTHYVFGSRSTAEDGTVVSTGRWSNIVRGAA